MDPHTPQSRYEMHIRSIYGWGRTLMPSIEKERLVELRKAATEAANPLFLYQSRSSQLERYSKAASEDESKLGGLHSLQTEVALLEPLARQARLPAIHSFRRLSSALGIEGLVDLDTVDGPGLEDMRKVLSTANLLLKIAYK